MRVVHLIFESSKQLDEFVKIVDCGKYIFAFDNELLGSLTDAQVELAVSGMGAKEASG